MRPSDFANIQNADYLEQLFLQFRDKPESVPEYWRAFFTGFEFAADKAAKLAAGESPQHLAVFDLVHCYRELGHYSAKLDPLGLVDRPKHPLLQLSEFQMSDADMDKIVGSGGFNADTDGTLKDLLSKLEDTYCSTVGVEYTGISDTEQRKWLEQHLEATANKQIFTPEQQRAMLFQLVAAEEFESFLARSFVGAKRFGIEGGESLIPLLNAIIDHGAIVGGEQFIMCMAHRGRLNTLAHVVNKPYETILGEFAGTNDSSHLQGDGDVKYHLGYANTRNNVGDKTNVSSYQNFLPPDEQSKRPVVKMSLLPNPSHLELINPIHQGIVRCKQEWLGDVNRSKVVPIQIHGDAAFVGQGIVAETLALSELPGWRTGGTIHVIINNQVGFTTPPHEGRFTTYPSDFAKAIQAPVFHVNGDDPEAVVHCAILAIEFRQKFRCDVIIDMWCYRKNGHNETDEPTFTQPKMYAKIKQQQSVQNLYAADLIKAGVITQANHDEFKKIVTTRLESARTKASTKAKREKAPSFGGVWTGMAFAPEDYSKWSATTCVKLEELQKVMSVYDRLPKGFSVHEKVQKTVVNARKQAMIDGKGIDFGHAEMLAFGSLLLECKSIRLAGQDVERGTFSHRHATLWDSVNNEKYWPLKHVSDNQGRFTVLNSMLSEEAVLGFEWGYASSDPRNLVLWEAQFGDFVNGAQNIIDQIIAAAESKWRYTNGMVLLLPHGYEGQGPEHSNAYLERWLSLCAEDNMQVAMPSTAAQYFHLLRRQMCRSFRKPLVLMMPKSLLRKAEATSSLNELVTGQMQLVIDDPRIAVSDKVKRVILCSGKVYHTLDAARQKSNVDDISIVRVEQFYPYPEKEIKQAVGRYKKFTEIFWVQEEPQNRGGWTFMAPRLREMFPDRFLQYAGREASASPAAGKLAMSEEEERQFVAAALNLANRAEAAGTK
jgi:2-oxoglutarate dehydrogenase E1 component